MSAVSSVGLMRLDEDVATSVEKVIVVDDEPQILSSIMDILEDDFQVLTASGAASALELLSEHEVAVILSDQRMPDMNGDEFLSRAKEISDATRILITGYTDMSALVRAVNHGQIYGYIAKPWDPMELRITVRTAADHCLLVKALRESEARLSTVFENAPIGMTLIGEDKKILKVNRALREMLGYASGELLGMPFERIVHPLDRSIGTALMERLFAEKDAGGRASVVRAQKRYIKKNGNVLWGEVTATLLEDRSTYGVGMLENITERKEAEEARERLVSMLEATPDVAVIVEKDGTPLYLNTSGRRLFGLADHAEVNHLSLPSIWTADSWETIENAGMPDAETKGSWSSEVVLVDADGNEIPVSLVLLAQRGPDGSVATWSLLARDIRDIKSLEAQMRQAQKMEAVGTLAGGVAHDFNNLLTAISGYAELVRAELPEDDPRSGDILEIEKAADRASRLTHQLLAFSRRQVLEPKVLDLNAVVADLQKMLGRLLGEHIELITSTSAQRGRIEADRGQLEQVIVNLSVNSRDAMPEGGRLTLETVDANAGEEVDAGRPGLAAGRYVVLKVTDTGTGMDAETLSRIFEPFYTTKGSGKGTGLGLSTVFGIVKQSGGWVYAFSEPGRGTSFEVYFPEVSDEVSREEDEREIENEDGTETILLVEDDTSVRALASRVLRRHGYRVLEAPNGAEALSRSEKESGAIDLLMTDVVLPGIGGPELARRLSERRPGIRILFMTGYSDRHVDEMVDGKSAALLMKPFTPASLARRLREVLERGNRGRDDVG